MLVFQSFEDHLEHNLANRIPGYFLLLHMDYRVGARYRLSLQEPFGAWIVQDPWDEGRARQQHNGSHINIVIDNGATFYM